MILTCLHDSRMYILPKIILLIYVMSSFLWCRNIWQINIWYFVNAWWGIFIFDTFFNSGRVKGIVYSSLSWLIVWMFFPNSSYSRFMLQFPIHEGGANMLKNSMGGSTKLWFLHLFFVRLNCFNFPLNFRYVVISIDCNLWRNSFFLYLHIIFSACFFLL